MATDQVIIKKQPDFPSDPLISGLECLEKLSKIIVQGVATIEHPNILIPMEFPYHLKDYEEKLIFYSFSNKDCEDSKTCCGPYNDLVMRVVDTTGKDVLIIKREFKPNHYCGGLYKTHSQECTVESPVLGILGKLKAHWRGVPFRYNIYDASGELVFQTKKIGSNVQIFTANNFALIGEMSKCRSVENPAKEIKWFFQNSTFTLTFPGFLDVTQKGLLLGSILLINFLDRDFNCMAGLK